MVLINTGDIPLVALGEMNNTHLEEVGIINKLYEAVEKDSPEVLALLLALQDHSVAHFSHEEQLMLECGFPAYDCHKGAHEDFLNVFAGLLKAYKENKDIGPVRVFLEGYLLEWLNEHISTMDTVTAMFVQKNRAVAS